MKIELLKQGLNVTSLHWALLQNPQLWNQEKSRTESPQSPHHELDDIWVRFGDSERVNDNSPHNAYWYDAADILGVKQLCLDVMHMVVGTALGGVLITRIPAGKECKPHADLGWHAKNYEKYAVQIAAAPNQLFCFDGEHLETQAGDLYWFNNQHTHWVTNPTNYERITMIICIRKEA